MAFAVKDWRDYPDLSTPITAAALVDLESRLSAYTDTKVAAIDLTPYAKLDGSTSFTGQVLASDGTQAAPGIAFSGQPGTGFYRRSAQTEINTVLAGTVRELINGTETRLHSGQALTWATGAPNATVGDVRIYRSGANALVLDNGAAGAANLSAVGALQGASVTASGSNGFFATGATGGLYAGSAQDIGITRDSAGSFTVLGVGADTRLRIKPRSGQLGTSNAFVVRNALDTVDTLAVQAEGGMVQAHTLQTTSGRIQSQTYLQTNTGQIYLGSSAGSPELKVATDPLAIQYLAKVIDGATAVAHILDTSVSLANASAKLASWRNAGVEKMYLRFDGTLATGSEVSVGGGTSNVRAGAYMLGNETVVSRSSTDAQFANNAFYQSIGLYVNSVRRFDVTAANAITATSGVADGATSVAHILDTTNSFVTAGAKIASFRNGGVEKAQIAYDGRYTAPAGAQLGPIQVGLGNTSDINNVSGDLRLYSSATIKARTPFTVGQTGELAVAAVPFTAYGAAIGTGTQTGDLARFYKQSGDTTQVAGVTANGVFYSYAPTGGSAQSFVGLDTAGVTRAYMGAHPTANLGYVAADVYRRGPTSSGTQVFFGESTDTGVWTFRGGSGTPVNIAPSPGATGAIFSSSALLVGQVPFKTTGVPIATGTQTGNLGEFYKQSADTNPVFKIGADGEFRMQTAAGVNRLRYDTSLEGLVLKNGAILYDGSGGSMRIDNRLGVGTYPSASEVFTVYGYTSPSAVIAKISGVQLASFGTQTGDLLQLFKQQGDASPVFKINADGVLSHAQGVWHLDGNGNNRYFYVSSGLSAYKSPPTTGVPGHQWRNGSDVSTMTLNGDGGLELPLAGKGLKLKSPDGLVTKTVTIDNSGALVLT